MTQFDNCPNCFLPLYGKPVCARCGTDSRTTKQYPGSLLPFTVLNNRYLLGRVLGKGGFGITYVAKDMTNADRRCAIKEYMPAEYSSRSGDTMNVRPFQDEKSKYVFNHGKDRFVKETETLISLQNDPNVVRITDRFMQNNTAYFVMELLEGKDLRKLARESGGRVNPELALQIFVTIASSLMEIHKKGILHRDLSPENIIYTNNGIVKLIDFGSARNFVSTQNKGMSILLKPGFAPPEQYNAKGAQGPWTDVYALCATFYNTVSGKPLVDALFRYRGVPQPTLAELGCEVTKHTSDVIAKGMELDYKKRYQTFGQLLNDLYPSKRSVPPVPPKPNPPKPNPPALPKSPPQPYVATVSGSMLTNKQVLPRVDVLKIGRSPQSCQYVIAGDSDISRIHCCVRYDGKNLYIMDVSKNGTFFMDGTRLTKNREYKINVGTRFYLAVRKHTLVVQV